MGEPSARATTQALARRTSGPAARGGPLGLRRARLPRGRHGRDRGSGRGQQTGSVPALPVKAGAVPRAPRRIRGRDGPAGRCGAGGHRGQRDRVHRAVEAYFTFVADNDQAYRLIFESDLRGQPGGRAGRRPRRPRPVSRRSPAPSPPTPGSTRSAVDCWRPAWSALSQVSARYWLTRPKGPARGGGRTALDPGLARISRFPRQPVS